MLSHDLIDSPSGRKGIVPRQASPSPDAGGASFAGRAKALAVVTVLLIVCFAKPLYELARYSLRSELFSHVLLVPFISLYLLRLKRSHLALDSEPARRLAAFPLAAGIVILASYWLAVRSGWKAGTEDYLAVMTLSFLLFAVAGCCLFLGARTLRAAAFPLAFLLFMVPFPTVVREWIESFFQHGSADAAYAMLKISGMPVFRDGLDFRLPGFSLHVAPECSGIHSSLVLIMTGLLAGHLLLRNWGTRTWLVLAVIPLGLLRNGFRIFTLGQLCVNVSPDWINSGLHHRGGPIFFVLSLVPFFLLLLWLRQWEAKSEKRAGMNLK